MDAQQGLERLRIYCEAMAADKTAEMSWTPKTLQGALDMGKYHGAAQAYEDMLKKIQWAIDELAGKNTPEHPMVDLPMPS